MRSARRASVTHRHGAQHSPTNGEAGQRQQTCFEAVNLRCLHATQPDRNSPKHISISYPVSDHEVVYESIILLFTSCAFFLQLLHIYRTVWWLPQSYEQNALKFYLVNSHLISYTISLIIPRWVWSVLKLVLTYTTPILWQRRITAYAQTIVFAISGIAHFYSIFLVVSEDSLSTEIQSGFSKFFRMGCLLYPSFLVVMLCYEKGGNFLELVPSTKSTPYHHSCTADPGQVRSEVNLLGKDFNARLKNVLYHSHISGVVCGLLPCCLSQPSVQFDIPIALQHFMLIWVGSLTLNAVQAFPPKYCDVLHSSARHLGFWDLLEDGASPEAQVMEWCNEKIWKQGAIVRYGNETYRARGMVNTAEPSCIQQKRYYCLFINAALLHISLLILQLLAILLQLILLFKSNEWYQMISLSLLQASNGYALFKLMRDTVVIWRLSLAEEMIQ